VNEVIDISRPKYKASSELEWVFSKFVLAMSGGFGSLTAKVV